VSVTLVKGVGSASSPGEPGEALMDVTGNEAKMTAGLRVWSCTVPGRSYGCNLETCKSDLRKRRFQWLGLGSD
jgi:hypothetical protein